MDHIQNILDTIAQELEEIKGFIQPGMTQEQADTIKAAIQGMSDQLQQVPPPPPVEEPPVVPQQGK